MHSVNRLLGAVTLSIGLLAAGGAGAVPAFPDLLTVHVDGQGTETFDSDELNCSSVVAGIYDCVGSGATSPNSYGYTIDSWNVDLDQDPSITANFSFTNTAVVTQTFVLTFTLPVSVFGPSSFMGGSLSGGTTDSGDGLGGVSTVSPQALYTGMIDGVLVGAAALLPHPFSVGYPFAFGSGSFGAPSFGLPGVTTPGPAVTSDIGIQFKFTLSPGDLVSGTAVFVVNPVPEPSTALLVGLGLAGVAAVRRRG